MITKPNNKILLHSLLIGILIILMIFYIENKSVRYVVASIIFINIMLNETTHLRLTSSKLQIHRNILLIIPTFRYTIRLKDIRKLHLHYSKDLKQDNFLMQQR